VSTVLLLGSGGREHAMAWKLAQSPKVTRKIAAPGNDGFSADWERWPIDLSLSGENARREFEKLAQRAVEAKVDLAVIGPDNPLAEGVTDAFEKQGILCFGPRSQAARLESSKGFAKEVMKAAEVPTAKFFAVESDVEAQKILKSVPWPKKSTDARGTSGLDGTSGPGHGVGGWVVKADGLALGKGVRVCASFEEASKAATELLSISGNLIIEEKLSGEEISWLALCDGENCALFEPARDHKTLREKGQGPNTGGMGAFSPVSGVPASWEKRVREEVFLPVLREMRKRGTPFKGVLYAGLMCDFSRDRFWVLEFNARFGDPEAQVLLVRMNGDLYEWCEAAASGKLSRFPEKIPSLKESAVVVVLAAGGYPEKPEKGVEISGLGSVRAPEVFFAGVKNDSGRFVTSGGRVLGVMGMGANLSAAREQAYQRSSKISFAGMQFRKDIGGEL
jgi:phosphoribosylamine--glycine ligase